MILILKSYVNIIYDITMEFLDATTVTAQWGSNEESLKCVKALFQRFEIIF